MPISSIGSTRAGHEVVGDADTVLGEGSPMADNLPESPRVSSETLLIATRGADDSMTTSDVCPRRVEIALTTVGAIGLSANGARSTAAFYGSKVAFLWSDSCAV